jgi:cbb3-type cytochrome oxidase maturation protein
VINLLYLIPLALFLGGLGLAAFVWSLRSGQYDDLDGAAHRVLFDDDDGEEVDTAPPRTPPDRQRAEDAPERAKRSPRHAATAIAS